MDDLDDIIKSAQSPDNYADHDTHIYELYRLIERLAGEVQRLRSNEQSEPSIKCPKCERTSFNPNDIEQGYCVNCHDWTTPARMQGDAGPEYYRRQQRIRDEENGRNF